MKNKLAYKFSYRRRLPHIQPEAATFFVTSRLAGSLPFEVIKALPPEAEKSSNRGAQSQNTLSVSWQSFIKWDAALDKRNGDLQYLADPRVASLVSESIHYHNSQVYDLLAFCIMPNHMHLVFAPLREDNDHHYSLSKIMHSLKRHTARKANIILGRLGDFWQHENYDHFVRNETELERIIKYVLHNPVKAGLVKEQNDWKWTYCKYDF